ncbi:MAG: endonuclease/exonuclease/phosphatase family protein [Gaiellaceae bacterium]
MALIVRTWNVFHGNVVPPERRAYLQEMVELISGDDPDVVCLQEVPIWALLFLERWSGMRGFCADGTPPRVFNAQLGRWITELNHGILRSAVTGEGIATLVARRHAVIDEQRVRIAKNRVVLSLRLEGGPAVVNAHVTGGAVAEEQFRQVGDLAHGDSTVLAGDFNLKPPYELEGFSAPLAGSIDQVLVRGLPSTGPFAWPAERRRLDGKLLSDHAPVEVTVG